jgi:hypothetical protein
LLDLLIVKLILIHFKDTPSLECDVSTVIFYLDKETERAEASLLTKILRTKLVENTHDVEVQRKDPNSPLYSVKSFEELRL